MPTIQYTGMITGSLSRWCPVLVSAFCISGNLFAQPANDNPCGAIALPVNAACAATAGTRNGATATVYAPVIPAPGCANYTGADVWYRVVVPANGAVSIRSTAGTLTDGGMAAYSSTGCANGNTFTFIECDDDDGPGNMPQLDLTCLTPGATIYIRFWRYGGSGGQTFSICAVTMVVTAPPANDNPCTATALPVNTTCITTAGTNVGACTTAGPPAPGCGNYVSGDVWFSFVAPASGIGIIESTAGTLTEGAMALYSGACGSLTLVECDDDDGAGNMPFIRRLDLVAGNTYFVRVWGFGGAVGTFNICVKSPTNPVGFSCSHLLELFDTGWDGWGTSTVTVTINGGSPTVHTCATGYEAILIGLNIGQVVAYTYSNTGPNQGQNEYQVSLFPSLALYFNSGTPPGNGLGYTKVVTCNPPSVLQEDCLGARTICGGAVSSYNPPNTGNNVDLNSGNYGCLSAAERQGTWYIYRVSSGGNLGMTVDPAGNDDYDWGIWGPYPTGSTTGSVCIPSGPPVRCTWASGPSTFAATGSYNTGMGHATYSPPQWLPSGTPSTENSGGDGWVSGIAVVTGEIYILYVSNYSQSGLSFTLSWQFDSGASLDCTVLPVELLTLGATAEGSAVSIDWATASETNSDYYVVERSMDAEHFEPIGTVEAAGESQHRIDYSFMDLLPSEGANYYRLKQVDLDGAYEHTGKVVVLFGKEDEKPTLFPNPVQDVLSVSFKMPMAGTAYVQLVDAIGRVVRDRDMDLERGQQTISIRTGGLSAGSYRMRLFTNSTGVPQTAQFVKE